MNQGCIKANRINPGAVIARLEVGYAGVEFCADGLVDAVCGGLVGECTTDSRVLAVCVYLMILSTLTRLFSPWVTVAKMSTRTLHLNTKFDHPKSHK